MLARLRDTAPDEAEKARYAALLTRVPPIATREREGVTCIAPAWSWLHIINHELPQLYPVYPYGLYGIGRDGLDLARNTYLHGVDQPSQRGHESWRQDGIFAARLGLTEEARRIALMKLDDGNLRFPAFWGPGYDWLPDHNWGGSGMIGLQEMLLQTADGHIFLFPAWPKDWAASFKLHLPGRTVVEASLANGAVRWSVSGNTTYNIVLPDGSEHQAPQGGMVLGEARST